MNLTHKFCTSCQLPKRKDGFRSLQGVVPKRLVCADCWTRIQQSKPQKVGA